MKRILIITMLLITFVPLLNICSGTSASAQYWADENGSLWDLADGTGYFEIRRCEYCGVFICGNSEDIVDMNMRHHLYTCAAYLAYISNTGEHGNSGGDLGGDLGGNEGGNVGEYEIGNGNSNSNNTYGIPVVDMSLANIFMRQLGITSTFLDEYDTYYGEYVSYPYASLRDFILFIIRYGATNVSGNNNYNYPFIGLYSSQYAIQCDNDIYIVPFNISTQYRTDYDYVFEFQDF